MNMIYTVKEGKSFLFPYGLKTVAAFDTQEEAESWIMKNLKKGQKMYIEPVEKLTKKELDDIMESHLIINIKNERS